MKRNVIGDANKTRRNKKRELRTHITHSVGIYCPRLEGLLNIKQV